jgi:D-sedoheptulose 7-phosphate isomerase
MNGHLQALLRRIPALEPCAADIDRAFSTLRDGFTAGGKALACGNGGSAADAEHWAGELLKGMLKARKLHAPSHPSLPPRLAESLQGALPMIPLTGFVSYHTAFGNDVDPEFVFAQLVWALGQPGDVLVALSTSGESDNVIAAAEAASAKGMTVLALTGAEGGRLAEHADVAIRVPAHETHLVQELHLPVYHCLSLMLEDEFFA